MVNKVTINGMHYPPEAVKYKLGVGKLRIKVIQVDTLPKI